METIGILSDAHGNYEAFALALDALRQQGAEHFYFLGDAVGYIPSARVLDDLMAMGSHVTCVRGNHEAMLCGESLDAARSEIYQLASVREQMSEEQLLFVRSWPASLAVRLGRFDTLMVHGSPSDPTNGYVYPDTDLEMFGSPADFVFMGHSHFPFIRIAGTCCYVNVGSCGLPRDDGRYGAAATFHLSSGNVEVIRFDITDATGKTLRSTTRPHASVLSVFGRRKHEIYGTFV